MLYLYLHIILKYILITYYYSFLIITKVFSKNAYMVKIVEGVVYTYLVNNPIFKMVIFICCNI